MNTTILKKIAFSCAAAGFLASTGCWTPPTRLAASQGNPSLVGAWTSVQADQYAAKVESIDAAHRKVVLIQADGTKATFKAGPQVVNFDQIQVGDKIKIKVAQELNIFLVKNGPPPSAGAGVIVEAAPPGGMPAGMVLETADLTARVIGVDRSYRLLTLMYADGKQKTIKVPLPNTLENAQKGDDVVVRETEGMILEAKRG